MRGSHWLNKLDPKQRFQIVQYYRDSGNPITRVAAALPDNFGISVGSVFTDPFNANITSNPIAEKVAAFFNFSRKAGARVTSVYYDGPEPTEISLELEFAAYYSGHDEVISPVLSLMLMAVGREQDYRDLQGQFTGFPGAVLDRWIEQIEESKGGTVADQIKLIRGPQPVRINFGGVMRIPAAYVSTVAPAFSNVLDNQFAPLHATCAITIKIERNPVYSDIQDFFGG